MNQCRYLSHTKKVDHRQMNQHLYLSPTFALPCIIHSHFAIILSPTKIVFDRPDVYNNGKKHAHKTAKCLRPAHFLHFKYRCLYIWLTLIKNMKMHTGYYSYPCSGLTVTILLLTLCMFKYRCLYIWLTLIKNMKMHTESNSYPCSGPDSNDPTFNSVQFDVNPSLRYR